MKGLITRASKLIVLAGAALALSLLAGCAQQPDPAQRAVNAANQADQAATRPETAAEPAKTAATAAIQPRTLPTRPRVEGVVCGDVVIPSAIMFSPPVNAYCCSMCQ